MAVLPLSPRASGMTEAALTTSAAQYQTTTEASDGDLLPGMDQATKGAIYLLMVVAAGTGFLLFLYIVFSIKMCLKNRGCCYGASYDEEAPNERNNGNRGQNPRPSGSSPLDNAPTGASPSAYPNNLPSVQSAPTYPSPVHMAMPKPSDQRPETPPPAYSCEIYPPPYSQVPPRVAA
ncbi:hypothetical protein FSARC_6745 [Fusarium sarcochroum]|uniref:Uncharacterized protein n=1 Tax=Fusarium sarcochroum TaxID=1208366 RepID=A0A8H4TWG2_9HYPO|nr:hypothetical protein FSARC_6745 [Fusarium sarcochroum]